MSSSSLHPPTVVHIASPCTSPTNAVPDSPLSSAPNSPGRQPFDDDDHSWNGDNHNDEDDNFPRTLEEMILELQEQPQLQSHLPTSQLDDRGYPIQRQNPELVGRQSRKSRLRASSRRMLHDHRNNDSSTRSGSRSGGSNRFDEDHEERQALPEALHNSQPKFQPEEQRPPSRIGMLSLEEKKSDDASDSVPTSYQAQEPNNFVNPVTESNNFIAQTGAFLPYLNAVESSTMDSRHRKQNAGALQQPHHNLQPTDHSFGESTTSTTASSGVADFFDCNVLEDDLPLLPVVRPTSSIGHVVHSDGNLDGRMEPTTSTTRIYIVEPDAATTRMQLLDSPLDEIDELLPNVARTVSLSSSANREGSTRRFTPIDNEGRNTPHSHTLGSRYENPVALVSNDCDGELIFPIQVVTADYPGDEQLPPIIPPTSIAQNENWDAVTSYRQHQVNLITAPAYNSGNPADLPRRVQDVEISYELQMTSCFQLPILEAAPSFDNAETSRSAAATKSSTTSSPRIATTNKGVKGKGFKLRPPPDSPMRSKSSWSQPSTSPFVASTKAPSFPIGDGSRAATLGLDLSACQPSQPQHEAHQPIDQSPVPLYMDDLQTAPTDESQPRNASLSKSSVEVYTGENSRGSRAETLTTDATRLGHTPRATASQGNDGDVPLDEILSDLTSKALPPSPKARFQPALEKMSTVGPSSPTRIVPVVQEHEFQKPVSKKDEFNEGNELDLTETTVSEDHFTSPEKNLMDCSRSSSDDSSDNDHIGPMITQREQHRPLLPTNSALDDLSSSDETPLRANGAGCSSLPASRKSSGRGSSRKNKAYGEPNMHEFWKQKPPLPSKPQRRQARKGNAKKSSAQKAKPSSDKLPPLVVDSDQLKSIGVNAIMAVCNGIGSLFLTNHEAIETPRRLVASVEPYKKLSPETDARKTKRTKGTKGNKAAPVRNEKWRQEWSPRRLDKVAPVASAAVFEEALQRSIIAELEAGDRERSFIYDDTDLLSTSLDSNGKHAAFDDELEAHTTGQVSMSSTEGGQSASANDGWWIEDQPVAAVQSNDADPYSKSIHSRRSAAENELESSADSRSSFQGVARGLGSSSTINENRLWMNEETMRTASHEQGVVRLIAVERSLPEIETTRSDISDVSDSLSNEAVRVEQEYSLHRVYSMPASFANEKKRIKSRPLSPVAGLFANTLNETNAFSVPSSISNGENVLHSKSALDSGVSQQQLLDVSSKEQSIDQNNWWKEPSDRNDAPNDGPDDEVAHQLEGLRPAIEAARSQNVGEPTELLPDSKSKSDPWWGHHSEGIDSSRTEHGDDALHAAKPSTFFLDRPEDEMLFLQKEPLFSPSMQSFEENSSLYQKENSLHLHSACSDEDTGWSLAKEIAKRARKQTKVTPNAAERIAAVREARSSTGMLPSLVDSRTSADKTLKEMDAPTIAKPKSVANHAGAEIKPTFPVVPSSTPVEPVLPSRLGKPVESSTPPTKLAGARDLAVLADPPSLRRVNVSLDLAESIGSPSTSELLRIKGPATNSGNTLTDDNRDELPSTEMSKPSPERSPMSDFLVSRMNSNVAKLVLQGTASLDEDDHPPVEDGHESDCSSTDELLSSLDGLVKDLDGLASARRIERTNTVESLGVGATFVPSPPLLPGSKTGMSARDVTKRYKGMPLLVDALNNDLGITKGDVMVSLLNSEQRESSTWLSRVDEAIWRCRSMRRHNDTHWTEDKALRKSGSLPQGRTSVCVDVDDARVVGGVHKVQETQKAAIEHLKYDDFDDAVALYEDICWSYEHYEEGLSSSDRKSKELKTYIATAHYNLGIVYLLMEEHEEALEYFERSAQLRNDFLGEGHVDHITSLVKCATCRFAMEEYATSFAEFERALTLSRNDIRTVSDNRQIAEVLNNLGCLSYMGGEIERAMLFFRESLSLQTVVSEHSMYIGSKFSCHAASLNRSITTANIGFLSLTYYRDTTESIAIFEAALKDQQLLLRDAHVTLISTMEHLVVANLLAGFQAKALQLLQRVFHMQVDALGPHHPQCAATRHKIILLEQGHEEIDEVDVVDNDKKEHMNNHKKANDSDIEIKDEIDKVKDVCDKIHDKNNIAMNGESNNDIKDGSNKGISNLDDSNHNDKDDQSPPMPFVDIQPAFVGDDDDDTRVERDGDFGSSHHDLSETNMLSAWRLVV